MGAVTVNPLRTSTYNLNDNPIKFGSATEINVASSWVAVCGESSSNWNTTNAGFITSESTYGDGVVSEHGAAVANQAGGTISSNDNYVEISGAAFPTDREKPELDVDAFVHLRGAHGVTGTTRPSRR